MSIRRAFRASYLLILAGTSVTLQACGGDAGDAQRSVESPLTAESVFDSSVFIHEYGIEPDRARLLANVLQEYLEAIGGPEAYANALKKIGVQPFPQSVQLYGSLLSLHGAVRLGKAVIDSLTAVRSHMFDLYYPDRCQFLVGARLADAESWRFIASMDSTVLNSLLQLYARTTLAEINESGSVPSFDRPRLVAAWKTFYSKLPISERRRFIRFLDAPVKSVKEECWFQRHFWSLLRALPEEDARVILWQIATNKFGPRR